MDRHESMMNERVDFPNVNGINYSPDTVRNFARQLGWMDNSKVGHGRLKLNGEEHKCYHAILKRTRSKRDHNSRLSHSELLHIASDIARKYGPTLECWKQTSKSRLSWAKDEEKITFLLYLLAKKSSGYYLTGKARNNTIKDGLSPELPEQYNIGPRQTYNWSDEKIIHIEKTTLVLWSNDFYLGGGPLSLQIGTCICKHDGSCDCAKIFFEFVQSRIWLEWKSNARVRSLTLILPANVVCNGLERVHLREKDTNGFRHFLDVIAKSEFDPSRLVRGSRFIVGVELYQHI